LYKWIEDDPHLKEAVQDAKESVMDLVESNLLQQAKKGNTAILIFLAKTLGKGRGYIERQEIDQKNTNINYNTDLSKDEIKQINDSLEKEV
jgi:hypothetical protein